MNEIIKRIQNGEEHLLNDLIIDNMDYIYSFTKKYYGIFEDYEELVQEAIIAFIESVYKYDFKKCFLNPYASIKIYYRVNKYVYENLYRICDYEKRYKIVSKLYGKCKNCIGHEPSPRELSRYYRIDIRFAEEILNIYNTKDFYLNIKNYKNYYQDYSIEEVERNVNTEIMSNRIKRSNLTTKQKELILTKFGFKDGKSYTFEYLANEKNQKKQATHSLYKKAEKKLKRILKNYY